MKRFWGRVTGAAVVCLLLAGRAQAHVGPPFPIVENQRAGPYLISVWAHPDLGTGAFYVILDPAPGTTMPEDSQVEVGVQPLTGRLPEATYPATRQDDVRDKVQYYAEAEFDQQEMWRVRVRVRGAAGAGEVISEVEPTPTTYGRWDLLIYSAPFVLFGALWLYAALRRWRRRGTKALAVRSPAEGGPRPPAASSDPARDAAGESPDCQRAGSRPGFH
jgi:hypothetical protein